MNLAGPDLPTTVIEAFSKRQVMDWSLVLASQDIPATIIQLESGWGLEVEPQQHQAALEAIHQYKLENRRWGWHRPIPWSEATFHWGSLGWCFLIILVHWICSERIPAFRDAGAFATKAVTHGEWWRTFTAVLLHADVAHLVANATAGFLLLGLAMARYGVGLALLATFLAGGAGNVAGFLLYPQDYIGLGGSGMVMGALGLISIPPFRHRWWRHRARRHLFQTVFAGIFLFLLFGVNPASDVLAHAGGFLGGALFGAILNAVPPVWLEKKAFPGLTWLALLVITLGPVWLALRHLP